MTTASCEQPILVEWSSTGPAVRVAQDPEVRHDPAMRFLTLADVAEMLNVSGAQAYALVRSGELPAIKVGGRGQWRVEAAALEAYITEQYQYTATFVRTHPR